MKKMILLVVAMVMTVGITEAATATKSSKTVTVSETFITDISCEHCTAKIMNYMPTQRGIETVSVDLPRKLVTISYNEKKTSTSTIIKRFSKIDINAKVYDAKQVTVTPAKTTTTTTTPAKTTTTTVKTTTSQTPTRDGATTSTSTNNSRTTR